MIIALARNFPVPGVLLRYSSGIQDRHIKLGPSAERKWKAAESPLNDSP